MENKVLQKTKTENGIGYTLIGDYYLPNLILPAEEKDLSFGKYGRMRKRYLEQSRRVLFVNLLTTCKLNEHLHEVDVRCNEMVEEIVKSLAKQDGVDENLKSTDQMKWVGLMNTFKSQAEEIVLSEVVYV